MIVTLYKIIYLSGLNDNACDYPYQKRLAPYLVHTLWSPH